MDIFEIISKLRESPECISDEILVEGIMRAFGKTGASTSTSLKAFAKIEALVESNRGNYFFSGQEKYLTEVQRDGFSNEALVLPAMFGSGTKRLGPMLLCCSSVDRLLIEKVKSCYNQIGNTKQRTKKQTVKIKAKKTIAALGSWSSNLATTDKLNLYPGTHPMLMGVTWDSSSKKILAALKSDFDALARIADKQWPEKVFSGHYYSKNASKVFLPWAVETLVLAMVGRTSPSAKKDSRRAETHNAIQDFFSLIGENVNVSKMKYDHKHKGHETLVWPDFYWNQLVRVDHLLKV